MTTGHDTTASGISWTLLSLARHPQYLARCQQEVDEILAGRESDEITWDDLGKMKYVTQCIKESLRLNTPVPFIERHLTRDLLVDDDKVTIPKGTVVNVVLYALHNNPLPWHDPRVSTLIHMSHLIHILIGLIKMPLLCRYIIPTDFRLKTFKKWIHLLLHHFQLGLGNVKFIF